MLFVADEQGHGAGWRNCDSDGERRRSVVRQLTHSTYDLMHVAEVAYRPAKEDH